MARGLARRAFSKEHGRDPTEEEAERMAAAIVRDDPTDDHLGAVTAEEADVQRDTASELLQAAGDSEPTDEMLSTFTEKLARAFRRAALEAVSDIETARRELVRRAVAAERTRDPFVVLRRVEAERRESERRIEPPPAPARAKASGGAAAPSCVAFGPPPRPADEGDAAGPAEIFEREARAEHEKVRVIAAASHGLWSSTDPELKETKTGRDNLLSCAEDDKKWDSQVKTCGDSLAKWDDRELHTAAADHAIAKANAEAPETYAAALQAVARRAYDTLREPGDSLDYPSLSSDDAVDIALSYTSVPWEDLEVYDSDKFAILISEAQKAKRHFVIIVIHEDALAKRERDAAAELKAREAQSLAAEADLLAQLDAEAGAAPKKKKKKKKKKKVAAPAPVAAPVAAPAVDEAPAPAVDAPRRVPRRPWRTTGRRPRTRAPRRRR